MDIIKLMIKKVGKKKPGCTDLFSKAINESKQGYS